MATTEGQDDQALVAAAQADRSRFLELYDRYFYRIYAYVLRRAGNRADAEDVTSEVFHRALLNLQDYQWRGVPFVAWLYRIAAHELADRRRLFARQAVTLPPEVDTSDAELERRVALFQLVDRLPADQRLVIEQRFGEDRSIRDVAETLGRSEGAVKQLQRRALENLRRGLESSHG